MDTQDSQLQARPELSQVKQEICRRIAEGETMASVCKDKDMPARGTVFEWRNKDCDFDQTLTRAYQSAGTVYGDKVLELAEECLTGNKSKDYAMNARVAGDSYKWAASKFYARVFGETAPRTLHQTLVHGDVTLVADEGQRQAMIQARDKFLTGKPVKLLDEGKPEA